MPQSQPEGQGSFGPGVAKQNRRGLAGIANWLGQPGSQTRRLLVSATAGIVAMLLAGGLVLDRVLAAALSGSFDTLMEQYLESMIGAAELGPGDAVRFTRPLGDQRFFEPYSGLYWQVSNQAEEPFRSRSLWDRALPVNWSIRKFQGDVRTLEVFPGETLRVFERDIVLLGTERVYRFTVAASVDSLKAQIRGYRQALLLALSALAFGLIAMAVLLAGYGLSPLRRVRSAVYQVRTGKAARLQADFVPEVKPLVWELNALLDYSDTRAEEARTHAGNLAHALKTPMSVLLNEARSTDGPLAQSVGQQVGIMKRHVDHHLARARALGRRANRALSTAVAPAVTSLTRALGRIYADKAPAFDIDIDGDLAFRGDRQELDEMLGNLMDNACKYGRGAVRVSAHRVPGDASDPMLVIRIEDDGPGIPTADRERLFARGERLDQSQPGTGIGLAIVRDIAEISGGLVSVAASDRLGGLAVDLKLPASFG